MTDKNLDAIMIHPEVYKSIKYNRPMNVFEKLHSFDWVFQDIDHAVYSVQSGSRIIPCPDCMNKIYEVLKDV